MNELRNGINTRLQSRENFDNIRSQFLNSRNSLDQQLIKPINQDELLNFHKFSDDMSKFENNSKINSNVNEQFEKYNSARKMKPKVNNLDFNKNDFFLQQNNTAERKMKPRVNNLDFNKDDFFMKQNNKQNLDLNLQKQKEIEKKQKLKSEIEFQKIKEETKIQQIKLNEESRNRRRIELEIKKKNEEILNQKKIIENLKHTKSQIYVPEIGNKRKLTNILLKVLKKRNLITNEKVIDKYIERYNLNVNNIQPNLLNQVIFEIKQEYKINNHVDIEFEEETKAKSFLISINSKDRDKKIWKCPNEYSISFAPQSGQKLGYINRAFDNVVSVQLVSAIFPKNCKNGDNLEDYPYIILEIDELGSNYNGTDDFTSKAFAQLTFDLDLGKYKKLVTRNDIEYKKNFNPRVSLNKFTLRIKTPDGKLYNFGNKDSEENCKNDKNFTPNNNIIISKDELTETEIKDISKMTFKYNPDDILNDVSTINEETSEDMNKVDEEDFEYLPINFVFKITCLQRKLENMYLNRRDS